MSLSSVPSLEMKPNLDLKHTQQDEEPATGKYGIRDCRAQKKQ